jgi:nitroimidazol reductase NimA-like FMN-containing flavoprotein (pyridoxamine 5'-phosphate oxidase superfamily)
MRRTDRQITDCVDIESILQESMICRLGLADGGEPYIVPLSYGYAEGVIYLHSALEGKKISMINKNLRCCFEIDQYGKVIRTEHPCSWGIEYRSVIGFGRVSIIKDSEEKKRGLNCIISHYGGGTQQFSDENIRNVCVIRIDIESMTGKKRN